MESSQEYSPQNPSGCLGELESTPAEYSWRAGEYSWRAGEYSWRVLLESTSLVLFVRAEAPSAARCSTALRGGMVRAEPQVPSYRPKNGIFDNYFKFFFAINISPHNIS